MASLNDIPSLDQEELILKRREEGSTYAEISEELCTKYPGQRGFSIRSVRRFCEEHGIRRSSRLSHNELRKVVATAVSQVREQRDAPCHAACYPLIHVRQLRSSPRARERLVGTTLIIIHNFYVRLHTY